MTQGTITHNGVSAITLTADNGYVLTNGKTYSDVGGIIYLGITDSIDNWYEITEAEAEELQSDLMIINENIVSDDVIDYIENKLNEVI